jgi:hypothetical protein
MLKRGYAAASSPPMKGDRIDGKECPSTTGLRSHLGQEDGQGCDRKLPCQPAAALVSILLSDINALGNAQAFARDFDMEQSIHPAATEHLPFFITAPGQTDYLFVAVVIFLLLVVLALGNLYFQLHAFPERRAHRTSKAQLEIVAVLALISLFTHNHIYWIAGLLLAFIDFPDFSTPLDSIAQSLAKLSGRGATKGEPAHVKAEAAAPAGEPALAKEKAAAPAAKTDRQVEGI